MMSKGLKLTLILLAFFLFLVTLGGFVLSKIVSDYISPTKAEEILLSIHRDAVIKDIDTESTAGKLFYEIDFWLDNLPQTATIDGKTGAVVADTAEMQPQRDINNMIPVPDIQAATEKALTDAGLTLGDVTITNAETKNHNGHIVYNIEFVHGDVKYQYLIDIETGNIDSTRTSVI